MRSGPVRFAWAAVRSLLEVAAVVLGVVTVVFVIGYSTGQTAARTRLGPTASAEAIAAFEEANGLNDPLLVQYFRYLGRLLQGDLGVSLANEQSIGAMLVRAIPVTASIAVTAVLLAGIGSIIIGCTAAVFRDSLLDRGIRAIASTGQAVPVFWVALLLIQLLAVELRWLPSGGYVPLAENPGEWLRSVAGPVLALGIPFACGMSRLVRASIVDELDKDYVRTARGLGLAMPTILMRHVMRNGLIAPVTVLGLSLGGMLGGAVLIEAVYRLPGLGGLVVSAIAARDFGLVAGASIVAAGAYVVINRLVDALQRALNPRPQEDLS